MKLRIHSNTIRLRLKKSEVARFAAAGKIEEVLEYGSRPEERLAYGMARSPSATAVCLDVAANRITIVVPQAISQDWVETERIAFDGSSGATGGKQVRILVEKEFSRLHGATLDPDLYPNPLAGER